jgi:hypothetical protein
MPRHVGILRDQDVAAGLGGGLRRDSRRPFEPGPRLPPHAEDASSLNDDLPALALGAAAAVL